MMYALGPVTVEPGERASMKVECSSMFRGERLVVPPECQGAFVITNLRTDGNEQLVYPAPATMFSFEEGDATSLCLETATRITLDVQSVAEHKTFWKAMLSRLAVLLRMNSHYWRNGWSFGLDVWWWVWPPRTLASLLRWCGVRKRSFGAQRFTACLVGMEASNEPVSSYLYSEPDYDICPVCKKDFEECECDDDTCPDCGEPYEECPCDED